MIVPLGKLYQYDFETQSSQGSQRTSEAATSDPRVRAAWIARRLNHKRPSPRRGVCDCAASRSMQPAEGRWSPVAASGSPAVSALSFEVLRSKEDVVHGYPREHDCERHAGPHRIGDQRIADEICHAGDEDGGQHRVAGDLVRTWQIGPLPQSIEPRDSEPVEGPDRQHE